MKAMVLRFCVSVVVCIVSLVVVDALAIAENSSWEGIRVKSGDGAFDVKFGGRIHNDWSFFSPDKAFESRTGKIEDGAEIRRAWIHTAGTIYKKVVYKAMYALDGGDSDLLEMCIGLKDVPYVGLVRIGHIREPFGLEQQNSCNSIMFMERSSVHELIPFRSLGAVIQNCSQDKRMTWALGLYRDSDSCGTGVGDRSYSLVGRLTTAAVLSPSDDRLLHLGIGMNLRQPEGGIVRYCSRPGVHLSPYIIDTRSFTVDREKIFNYEIAGVFNELSLQHETFVFLTDGRNDQKFYSSYLQGSWCLNGSRRTYDRQTGAFNGIVMNRENWYGYGGSGLWELVARYSYTDLDDGNITCGRLGVVSLGLNWYLNPASRVMVNYIRSEREDIGKADILATRFQVKF